MVTCLDKQTIKSNNDKSWVGLVVVGKTNENYCVYCIYFPTKPVFIYIILMLGTYRFLIHLSISFTGIKFCGNRRISHVLNLLWGLVYSICGATQFIAGIYFMLDLPIFQLGSNIWTGAWVRFMWFLCENSFHRIIWPIYKPNQELFLISLFSFRISSAEY